jgi:oxaloacetate decarboxylase beta subunit
MIGIACLFLYLAIKKGFEPYLLIPSPPVCFW